MTSIVLPFPAGRAQPEAPEVRLARALDQLAVALAEQHAAVSAWREALHDLKIANHGLGESLMKLAWCTERLAGAEGLGGVGERPS